MGCFSGHLMSAASDQKLFCEVCSVLNCSFDEFVEEKVISPSYSSAILIPPHVSSLISFINVLWFSMYMSLVSLGRYIPKYFIHFVAMVNGIFL